MSQLAKEAEELKSSEKFRKVTETTQETLRTATEDFYDHTRLKESELYRWHMIGPKLYDRYHNLYISIIRRINDWEKGGHMHMNVVGKHKF